ncbi:MAG: hybrid sensor histidine kinase/response regulator [Nitrospinae bacterium]|nr:hybrid sensor histidine kinase/response regulator [Nitrospinota bacterium]
MPDMTSRDDRSVLLDPPAPAAQAQSPVILAVDDEESNLLVLKRPLQKEGYRLITSLSGSEALDILAKTEVDLVLVDWMMPGLDGAEVCRRIKADPALSLIPVIMITAKSGSEDLALGMEAGANDYLRKPVDKLELMARVRSGLREMRIRKELRRSNDRLRELNKMKDEVISIVSHDLRSPLATIIGFSELLLEDKGNAANNDLRKPLEIIKKSAKWQLSLVDNLLDVAKLEAGGMELDRTQAKIGDIVQSCAESFAVTASIKEITLSFNKPDTEPQAGVDIMKISQAVNNLISNAIKFTPRGGTVTVKLFFTETQAVISVKDSGPGLNEDDMAKLFKKFQQTGVRATNGEKGTGLGLVITKNIAELHGGSVDVKSVPGDGCEFTITLPAAE